jgi:methylmalonyl-CoA/ethylmalonyl-CoA epimerase
MANIKSINHIAIVVDDIEAALGFWRDDLGLQLDHVENVSAEKSIVAFLPLQDSEVELVKPTAEDTGVSRFLKSRGPGLHHICFEVDDIDEMLIELRNKGVKLINDQAVTGTGGKKIAFIHPQSTHGVLVELYELTAQEPIIRIESARTLADRVLVEGQTAATTALEFLRGLRPRNGPGTGP